MAALCATLIEHREIGVTYSERIRLLAGTLSRSLVDEGVVVLQDGDQVTETHQVFLHVEPETLDSAYDRAAAVGITLNKKRKALFRETGLRLGVQEIARYRWTEADVRRLASILSQIVSGEGTIPDLRNEVRDLAQLNEFAEGMSAVPTP
jgi:glycine/serine hydroxymethyltransferase